MLAGTILIPAALEPSGPAKPGVRVKDLAIVIETRQTAGVKSKSLYVVLLRLSKEKPQFWPRRTLMSGRDRREMISIL
jgi:hypothetical protein